MKKEEMHLPKHRHPLMSDRYADYGGLEEAPRAARAGSAIVWTVVGILLGLAALAGLIYLFVWLFRKRDSTSSTPAQLPFSATPWRPSQGGVEGKVVSIQNPESKRYFFADGSGLRLVGNIGTGWSWTFEPSGDNYLLRLEGTTPRYLAVGRDGTVRVTATKTSATPFNIYRLDSGNLIFESRTAPFRYIAVNRQGAIGASNNPRAATQFVVAATSAAPLLRGTLGTQQSGRIISDMDDMSSQPMAKDGVVDGSMFGTPTRPAQPQPPFQPAQPVQPQPVQPAQPAFQPAQPQPVQPAQPAFQPAQPQPVQPSAQPVQPPTRPVQPIQPAQPVQPVQPSAQPVQPSRPITPPAQPIQPRPVDPMIDPRQPRSPPRFVDRDEPLYCPGDVRGGRGYYQSNSRRSSGGVAWRSIDTLVSS